MFEVVGGFKIAYALILIILIIMNNKLRNFLAGIGSVLAIMPTGSVAQVKNPNQRSDCDNLRGDWERVGSYLHSSLKKSNNEQQKKNSR
ncbi:MAG: hypothetical protein HOB14_00260 [Gammaproteobacteria bacterium]|nr:hypothetical protein [Gammaproteobacteria bacterium]MBT4193771.1 hypothetical protein [Gammaproteobacteria bacterium]MBT4452352.1 hypothetical protein [Gammaproteobacteria bacterium]MBT4861983.1 hypothetical protein [Gammaproteobacteria bacterium]MBT6455958.1 hypothetical protein [Gammaproteobacteria bacterium]